MTNHFDYKYVSDKTGISEDFLRDLPEHEMEELIEDMKSREDTKADEFPNRNVAVFQRDLATRQLRVAKAQLQLASGLLRENRPLEALHIIEDAIEEHEDALDALGVDDD